MELDTLGGRPAEVALFEGASFGGRARRAPHRHDYHEVLWLREGRGEQRIDDETLPVQAGTVVVVGRGQVHQFTEASGIHGAVLRVTEELLQVGRLPAGRAIVVPAGETTALEAVLRAAHDEAARPRDRVRDDVCAHLVAAVLLWVERWATAAEGPAEAADVRLTHRFLAVLDRDFAHHHDARHYAEVLGVPQAALSRVLAARTGRTTKALVLDRVLTEAARLLRFSDDSVGEIAWAVGFRDPLHFSRAFKRRFGMAPSAYRDVRP